MRTKILKVGGSLYLRIPHEKVVKHGLESKMDIYIHEDLWDEMFEDVKDGESSSGTQKVFKV